MRAALREALKGRGHTSPNPAVGAVLARRRKIIARGYHKRVGAPHAEIECLNSHHGRIPEDAALYVTLEPCSTVGRTPACTEALITSGVRKVVVGAMDPNPQHQGRGIETLRAAGLSVQVGILAEECTALNEGYNHWIQTKRPFVIAKCAMGLDGRLTLPCADEKWITGAKARRHANEFRAQVDAILVGAETVRTDNPLLTARHSHRARQPWRVVLSRSGRLPERAHLFTDRFAERTLVFRERTLRDVLRSLGEREITTVLIEGGGDVLGQALDQKLIQRVHIYFAPLLSGGPVVAFSGTGVSRTSEGVCLGDLHYERLGPDAFLSAKTKYRERFSE
jgi:diaminohydroxyphosphoribosylaminopyrimidine deaminase / 5-amino-6-(5-phosphoribosylamino)uracil reductase